MIKSPAVKKLERIRLVKPSNVTCQPIIKIYHCKGLNKRKLIKLEAQTYSPSDKEIVIDLSKIDQQKLLLAGDIMIKFHKQDVGSIWTYNVCRLQFNTAFIEKDNFLVAGKKHVSPESLQKEKNRNVLPEGFRIELQFSNYCDLCDSRETEINDLCERCIKQLNRHEDQVKSWKAAKDVF